MKIVINLVAFILCIAGAIFKLESWAMANICVLVGIVFLILGILVIGIKENLENGISTIHNFLTAATALTLCVGSAFKFMHWQGADVILVFTSLGTLGMVLTTFQDHKMLSRLSNQIYISFLMMVFLASALGGSGMAHKHQNDPHLEQNVVK